MDERRRGEIRDLTDAALVKVRSAVQVSPMILDIKRTVDLAEAVNMLIRAVELLNEECHALDARGDIE